MFELLPLFALLGVGPPVGGAVYSAVRWALDRHALTVAFTRPRERRRHPNLWRQ